MAPRRYNHLRWNFELITEGQINIDEWKNQINSQSLGSSLWTILHEFLENFRRGGGGGRVAPIRKVCCKKRNIVLMMHRCCWLRIRISSRTFLYHSATVYIFDLCFMLFDNWRNGRFYCLIHRPSASPSSWPHGPTKASSFTFCSDKKEVKIEKSNLLQIIFVLRCPSGHFLIHDCTTVESLGLESFCFQIAHHSITFPSTLGPSWGWAD